MAIYPEIQTLADISRYHAIQNGSATALIFENHKTTYRELDERVNQVANGLLALGVKAQARVAYLAKNRDSYYELLLGLAKFGGVMVGVNWRLAAPEVHYILNDAQAKVLVLEADFFPILDAIKDDLPHLTQIIVLTGKREDANDYTSWRQAQSTRDPQVTVELNDIAMQLYTSGTTGHPKGVLLSHRSLMSLREVEHKAGEWARWRDGDTTLVVMPVFHIGGASMGLQGLYNAATTVILAMADPGEIIRLIRQYQVTRSFVVPAVILFMVQHPECKPEAFKSLECLFYGASPIPGDLLKQAVSAFDCGFVQVYGMTETAGSMTYLPFEDHSVEGTQRMASCGKPYPGIEIAIVDDHGMPVATNVVGEIIIKSPSLMDGYWNLPEATEQTIKNGWLYSGDAGYLDEDGYLYIFDRVKDMIVSGGENIYPVEVENALFGHPKVKEIAVIGVPSEKWGEAVKAVVVPEPGSGLTDKELLEFARTRIAGFKIPKSIDFVEELPRNPTGKVLKREIRKPYWQGYRRQIN